LNQFEEIERLYSLQSENKSTTYFRPYKERKEKLKNLLKVIYSDQENILSALHSDLNKSYTEGKLIEIYPVLKELKYAIRNLKEWMRPRSVPTPITMFGAKSTIVRDPKGMSLVISPWNYPFILSLSPIISAVAAGNTVILKPSEKSPATSSMLKQILLKVFDEKEVAVIEGDYKTSQTLLSLKFDHIFFTGSPAVGKIVMEAASKHLTSVTLELGGKSPVIVDGTYNLITTAKRIAWGKLINAGQTCIAPDYLLVKEEIAKTLVEEIVTQCKEFYNIKNNFSDSEIYPRIIDDGHTKRISNIIENEKSKGSSIVFGGSVDDKNKYIEPTFFSGVKPGNPIMNEEIFGPLLPVITFKSEKEVVEIVNEYANPLSLYLFSSDKKFVSNILKSCPSGGVTINDTLLHFANPNLPFGGIQNSGIGKSHGEYGFLEFTNQRAIVTQSRFTPVALLYPPYTRWKQKLTDFILKYF
jgi:aldehyde dehydrogenase (NAD+)